MLELKSAVLLLIFCLLSLLLFSCLSVDYLNIRSPSWFICSDFGWVWASLVAQRVKHLPAMQETQVWSLGGEDPLEKKMSTHSSILAWKTPWMEKPCGLQSMELNSVRHIWATSLSLSCLEDVFACQIKLSCDTGPSVASKFAVVRQNGGNYNLPWHIAKRKIDDSNPKITKMMIIST